MFAYSSFAFHLFSFQFSSEIQLRWPRLETRLIDGLLSIPPRFQVIDQNRFPVNIPSNNIPLIESMVYCSPIPNLVNAGWL